MSDIPYETVEEYVDALDHIMRVASNSATQTRRLRWIAERARCALEGGDWRALDLPKIRKKSIRELKLEKRIKELEGVLEELGEPL